MNYQKLKAGQLGDFFRIAAVQPKDEVEQLDKDVALLSMIHGKPDSYFTNLSFKDFNEYRKQLYALLSVEPSARYIPAFKVNGYKFTCLPNVNTIKVHHEQDVKMLRLNADNLYDKLPYIVAIFSEQRKQLFKKQLSFVDKCELFKKHLPADVAIGIALFFCAASKKLEPLIATYLEELTDKLEAEVNKALASMNIGDGN
jgi:hypothetical protein